MNPIYAIDNTSLVLSPGLLFYKDIIQSNIEQCLRIAGSPDRLRPHVKTHKTREIVRLQLAAGITKHKCATISEAEMLASCGVPDVLIAYNLVGPNFARLARLVTAFPATRFGVLADQVRGLKMLSAEVGPTGQTVEVLLDIDVGQHRTGIALGPAAEALYAQIHLMPGLVAGGLHVYDGHNRQEKPAERRAAVDAQLSPVLEWRQRLEKLGLSAASTGIGRHTDLSHPRHLEGARCRMFAGDFCIAGQWLRHPVRGP